MATDSVAPIGRAFGELKGWDLVESLRERFVSAGYTKEEYYRRHFEGEEFDTRPSEVACDRSPAARRMMDSLAHYLKWKDEHPDVPTPPSIRRVRTDRQHEEWAKQGYPPPEREQWYCHIFRRLLAPPPRARSIAEIVEVTP